jgi:hypothetical protein
MTRHLLFSMVAAMLMAAGTVSAQESGTQETETFDFSTQGWADGDSLTLMSVKGENVTLTFNCTASRTGSGFMGLPTYKSATGDPCVSLFGRCNIIVTANSGKAITEIDFTFANNNRARISGSSKKPNCVVTTTPADTREATDDDLLPGWNFSKNLYKCNQNATKVTFGKSSGGGQIDVASIVVYTVTATGITNVIAAGDETAGHRVYTLSGNCVGTSLTGLPKGIYIQGGKKFIVR